MDKSPLERQAIIKRVLAGAPAVEDPEQLALLAEMGFGELSMVSALLKTGEAATVEEAVEDLRVRRAACREAERRRGGFRKI